MILKYRAWDKKNNAMTDVRTIDFDEKTINDYLHGGNSPKRYFDDIVLMQSTGLKDKNGVEIFEGDIVDCFAGEYRHGIWEYQNRFSIECGWTQSMWEMLNCDQLKVIGNVHETPELVEVEE